LPDIPDIKLPTGHTYRIGEDPARMLLRNREFLRPSIAIPNGPKFIWPIGTEGFEVSGQANLGIHKYIGELDIDANVIYLDEPRIVMSDSFPGHTAAGLMRELQTVLRQKAPEDMKILYLPLIFPRLQFVTVESYNFSHDGNDRTRSIAYTVSFLKVGIGRKKIPGQPDPPDENPIPEPPNPTPPRYFRVKDGHRTLRKISAKVYKNPDRWKRLYKLNEKKINKWKKEHNVPQHKLPTARLPLGMKLLY